MSAISSEMRPLSSVKLPKNWNKGISCGFSPFDELLGNMAGVYGARPGSVLLLSAPPGTGKSRLSLTVGNLMVQNNEDFRCGYFPGEQSVAAAAVMGKTMEIEFNENFLAATETSWEAIKAHTLKYKLNVIIIDSFPMIDFEPSESGKPLDTKQKSNAIKTFAEDNGIFVILINHTNRKGERGGRNELLHLVDIAYTLRKVSGNEAYGNLNVVEFISEKNRDGSPISRAFPFNGKWDLSYPMELASSDGDSGGSNLDLEEKKNERKNLLIDMILEKGKLEREEIENNSFVFPGVAASGVISMLRDLASEGRVNVTHVPKKGKGRPQIKGWTVNDAPESDESEDSTAESAE